MHHSLASFRFRLLAGMAAIAAAWGLLGAALAQPSPDVTLWISTDSVTTGEPFTLTVEGNTPAHRGIGFPSASADSVFGALEVLSRSDVHTRRVGGGYAIDSVSYTVQTSARDSVRIPAVPIRIDVAVGTLTTFTEPRTVRVRTGRVSSALNPFGGASPNALGWFVLVVAVGGALYGTVHLWRRSRDEAPAQNEPPPESSSGGDAPSDPCETARRQLRALEGHDLADPDAVEAVHVALADVVRTYLSRQLGLTTKERTTEDLLALLDRRADVPPNAVEPLQTALEQADRVKFAGARPNPAATEAVLRAARTALDRLDAAAPPSPDADPQSE